MTGSDKPQPGDFTVCIACASVLRWTATMDFELSSLMAVPTHIRMDFAKLVSTVKTLGPYSKRNPQ